MDHGQPNGLAMMPRLTWRASGPTPCSLGSCRVSSPLTQEQNAREQKYQSLREELEESKRMREKGDEKFQTFILEEVAALKNGLVMESQAREQADDDIVQALNHYTKALQDALRIVNQA